MSDEAPLDLDGLEADLSDAITGVLTVHYVTAIDCDHNTKTDTVRCNCSVWTGTPQPSVGDAVQEWIAHVLDRLAANPSTVLRLIDAARLGERDHVIAFAKALFKEVPLCTGCDFDHGWDDHVIAVWNGEALATALQERR